MIELSFRYDQNEIKKVWYAVLFRSSLPILLSMALMFALGLYLPMTHQRDFDWSTGLCFGISITFFMSLGRKLAAFQQSFRQYANVEWKLSLSDEGVRLKSPAIESFVAWSEIRKFAVVRGSWCLFYGEQERYTFIPRSGMTAAAQQLLRDIITARRIPLASWADGRKTN